MCPFDPPESGMLCQDGGIADTIEIGVYRHFAVDNNLDVPPDRT